MASLDNIIIDGINIGSKVAAVSIGMALAVNEFNKTYNIDLIDTPRTYIKCAPAVLTLVASCVISRLTKRNYEGVL